MKYFIIFSTQIIITIFFIKGCVTAVEPPDLNIKPIIEDNAHEKDLAINRFENLLKEYPSYQNNVQDVYEILKLRRDRPSLTNKQLRDRWFDISSIANEELEEFTFSKFVDAEIEFLKPISLDNLTERLFAYSQSELAPNFLKRSKLKSAEGIKDWLLDKKDLFKVDRKKKMSEVYDPSRIEQMELADKSLSQILDVFCDKAALEDQPYSLDIWLQNQAIEKKVFIEGVLAGCSHDYQASIRLLKQSRELIRKESIKVDYLLNISHYLIAAYKGASRRDLAAEEYLTYGKLWTQANYSENAYPYTKDEFYYHKLNQIIWSARYRALIGDYENALRFIDSSFSYYKTLDGLKPTIINKWWKKIEPLHYESYHVKASRILIEQKRYHEAYLTLLEGLRSVGDDEEWKDRFVWYSGLFSLLKKDYSKAEMHFESLLTTTKNDQIKTQVLFWLSDIQRINKNSVKESFYMNQLLREDPFDYYTLYALSKSNKDKVDEYLNGLLVNAQSFSSRLSSHDYVDLKVWRKDSQVAPYLKRSEFLVAAGIDEFSAGASLLLRNKLLSRYDLAKNFDRYIYFSRIDHGAHNYFYSIDLTHNLYIENSELFNKYPEQTVVMMPMAFLNSYRKANEATGIAVADLLAISRQESSFRPKVKSHADAVGLMQLIVPTARRYGPELEGLSAAEVIEKLEVPSTNVLIGARYLKSLYDLYGSKEKVFAAYNAGEYAVDRWQSQRQIENELLWVEFIPYSETRNYVKKVMKNATLYDILVRSSLKLATTSPKMRRLKTSH